MEIREMKYLKEIMSSGTFAKAAESLYISQPALSKAVKRMEKNLGFNIFKKIGTKNVLTSNGIDLMNYIDKILIEYEAFEENLLLIESKNKHINYGVIPYYCTPFTTVFLYNFKNKFPEIKINMIEAPMDILLEMLMSEEIDVAMTESAFESSKVTIHSAFQDDVSVAVGKNSPLYHEKSLTFHDLMNYPFNFVTNSDVLKKQVTEGCSQAGYTPKIGYQSSQIAILLENTKMTQNICILNRPMIFDNISVNKSLEGIRIIPLNPSPQCYCYVSYKSGRKIKANLKHFLDEITEQLTVDTRDKILG
jgi:DNA-binding transcriptional LysR family regulator